MNIYSKYNEYLFKDIFRDFSKLVGYLERNLFFEIFYIYD